MPDTSPIVSVIIPTYNHAHFIGEAIQSVLNQIFSDFEVIIVDDGSTDNTVDIVGSFVDKRIKYLYQDNKGLAAARNTGLRSAKGEFVVFLDADDILLPNKLAVQVAWLQTHVECCLVASGYFYMDEQGRPLQEQRPWLTFPKFEIEDWLFYCPVGIHCILIRKRCVEQVGGFDDTLRMVADYDLWLRLAHAECKMEWVKEIVCGYRLSAGQMTRNAAERKHDCVRVIDKFFNQTDLSLHLRALKRDVYAHLYLACAGREYGVAKFEAAQASIVQALKYKPELLGAQQCELVNELLSWTENPFVGDPIAYTNRIFNNLPQEAKVLLKKKHWALGEIGLRVLFQAYASKNWHKIKQAGLTVAINAPYRLLNRGVLSILCQSLKY
jgi:glycosyltransferase involved in cell wall biosynthesis